MNRFNAGDLAAELSVPGSPQPDTIAEIIQRVRPDVLLINEFDFDASGVAAAGFRDNYLSVAHGDAVPIIYPYYFVAPSNTGIYSGFDLDNSGAAGDFVPNDSFGFGFFPGQFGMVVYSMFPIDFDAIRTFRMFLWKDMPGALLPNDPAFDTADFNDSAPGNLRADYVLPRKSLKIIDAAVFWPTSDNSQFPLVGTFPFPSSDHRLVWVDVRVPGAE